MYGGGCEAPPKFPFRNEGSITLAAGCAVKNSLRLSASFRFTSVEESSLTQCLPYPLPREANIQSGGAIKVLPPGYANSPDLCHNTLKKAGPTGHPIDVEHPINDNLLIQQEEYKVDVH